MIFKKQSEGIWASISDLMTGLMVIFLFVCIAFLYQLGKYKEVNDEIHSALIAEFKDEITDKGLGTGILNVDDNLRVTFLVTPAFFDVGDNTVKPEFQKILANFFPRYVKVLEKYNDQIVEVRIEGNASREYKNGDMTSNDAYFYNMKLSQERAFNVLQYVFTLNEMQDKRNWMIEKLRANGASYSKATDDANASRCVEISIIRNAEKELKRVSEGK